jgi:hypothetical protein
MKTEGIRAGEFVVSEGNGAISREKITVAEGANLVTGTVLGKITATGLYVMHDNGLSNGAQNAAAILYADVDATDGDKAGVAIERLAEVHGDLLTFKAGISGANKTAAIAALAAKNIIVR